MDPDHALSDLITSLVAGDTADAVEIVNDLLDWIDGGGFPPRDPRA
jgi:hypothetical protein